MWPSFQVFGKVEHFQKKKTLGAVLVSDLLDICVNAYEAVQSALFYQERQVETSGNGGELKRVPAPKRSE